MAKKEQEVFDYNAEVSLLKTQGPQALYFLSGPEDYLRECFLSELRKLCNSDENEFSYKKMNGPTIDMRELDEAVNAMPFFTDHVLVEVRDYDINHCRDNESDYLKSIISDIPDYCTLVFVFSASYTPDGRLSTVKMLKKGSRAIQFTEQSQSSLNKWVRNRFASFGKSIAAGDADYLIFLSGTRMSGLIPEIEKIAAYSQNESVCRADIDAVATRIPEADVFSLSEQISQRKFDAAAKTLSDLLTDKENHPIMLTALIGQHMRQLYAVKLGKSVGRSQNDTMELASVRFPFVYEKLSQEAKSYSLEELEYLVKLCAEYDYRLKSTGIDPNLLIKDLFARIAVRK